MADHRPHWRLTENTIGALIEVHRRLGPGLLESVYELCVAEELRFRSIHFFQQVPIRLTYRNAQVACGYRADLIVEDNLLIELKAVEALTPVHVAQTLTYLKLLRLDVALLVNFNTPTLKTGIRRLTRADLGPVDDHDERGAV